MVQTPPPAMTTRQNEEENLKKDVKKVDEKQK
jgi:hypothetical protein